MFDFGTGRKGWWVQGYGYEYAYVAAAGLTGVVRCCVKRGEMRCNAMEHAFRGWGGGKAEDGFYRVMYV